MLWVSHSSYGEKVLSSSNRNGSTVFRKLNWWRTEKEAKNEAKNDALSMIIKSLKNLASRVPGQEETVKNLEIFRLKMILR